jgi:hypothetical protein
MDAEYRKEIAIVVEAGAFHALVKYMNPDN